MTITFSDDVQKLIEQRMRESGIATPEEVVRLALEKLEGGHAVYLEDLDPELQKAIETAEAELENGEGIPADQAFAMLRKKHFGQ